MRWEIPSIIQQISNVTDKYGQNTYKGYFDATQTMFIDE